MTTTKKSVLTGKLACVFCCYLYASIVQAGSVLPPTIASWTGWGTGATKSIAQANAEAYWHNVWPGHTIISPWVDGSPYDSGNNLQCTNNSCGGFIGVVAALTCPANYTLVGSASVVNSSGKWGWVWSSLPYCMSSGVGVNPPKSVPGVPGPGQCAGNPINISAGNKFQLEEDYSVGTIPGLTVRRYYNSTSVVQKVHAAIWGAKWNGGLDRYIQQSGNSTQSVAFAYRADGKVYGFTLSALGTWDPDTDVNSRLTALKNASGAIIGWQLFDTESESTETYNSAGKLLTITGRDGRALTFVYNASGAISTITEFAGRQTVFAYDAQQRISAINLPDGNQVSYAYGNNNNLVAVTFPDSTTKSYHYEDTRFLNALTGITDERGVRYATYSYDSSGRAISSEHSGGADRHTLTFGTNATTVTDPLGTARTYAFQTILGVVKNTGVSQPGGSGCGPAAESLTYDANGNISSRTDFNGRKTTYAYDLARNLETSRTEGLSGSGAALPETRTLTTSWHATWRLPVQVNEYAGASASGNPLRRTSTTYDSKGNITSRSVTDVALGVTRTWTTTYTYSVAVPGLMLQKVEDGPRTEVADTVTTDYYPHDEACAGAALGTGRDKGCRGQAKRVTNALGQATQFTRYNAHGQVEEIVDPNGVLTTLTYDLRQRLTSRATAGETTGYQYDGVGQLTRLTLPDGSTVAYTYDGARRLTAVADSLGNSIAYTLDLAGNRTKEDVLDPQGALVKTLGRAYDALGRLQTLTGVAIE